MRKRNAFRPVLGDRTLEGRTLLTAVPGVALVDTAVAAKLITITGSLNGSLSDTGHYTGTGTLKPIGMVDASGSVNVKKLPHGSLVKGSITLVSESNHANSLTVSVEGRSVKAGTVPVRVRITSGTGFFAKATGYGSALFKSTSAGDANFTNVRVIARTG